MNSLRIVSEKRKHIKRLLIPMNNKLDYFLSENNLNIC